MVKKFERSSADKAFDDSDLRKPLVLFETVKYLIQVVNNNQEIGLFDTYKFIQDRMRCVRQDFKIIFSKNSNFKLLKESVLSYELMLKYVLEMQNPIRYIGKELDE